MELLIFGWGGARVLVFPTSMGRYYEWEDRGMMNTWGEQIERGWLQVSPSRVLSKRSPTPFSSR